MGMYRMCSEDTKSELHASPDSALSCLAILPVPTLRILNIIFYRILNILLMGFFIKKNTYNLTLHNVFWVCLGKGEPGGTYTRVLTLLNSDY